MERSRRWDTTESAHKSAQDSVRELGPFGEQRQQLEAARGQIEWDRTQLGQAESDSERLRRELEAMEERRKRLATEVEGLPEAEARRARHERRREELDGALGSARVAKGVLEEAIARCERLAGEVVELKRQRGKCLREQSLYQELALAFGKNGIQALIIEDAIPQLDSDANELLGRLTDNRMSLRLELGEGRRVRGTDAPSEELRINIADEMGTRAYETFSGGRGFQDQLRASDRAVASAGSSVGRPASGAVYRRGVRVAGRGGTAAAGGGDSVDKERLR